MPKIIENYQLQSLEFINSNKIEYFRAKQIGSNKLFTLKRLKKDSNISLQPTVNNDSSNPTQDIFKSLLYEIKILKKLQHQSIPKCLKMLKTSNSIYFVHEYQPTTSLREYMKVRNLKFVEKLQLSRAILQILKYIHGQNISYGSMNSESIMVDKRGKPFFTNYQKSTLFQKNKNEQISTTQNSRQQKINKYIFEDIFYVGKLIFEIFQFSSFCHKFHIFTKNTQKKIYIKVCEILQKNIERQTMQILTQILSQKVSPEQTQCTETPQSPFFDLITQNHSNIDNVKNKTSTQRNIQENKISISCSKEGPNNFTSRCFMSPTRKKNAPIQKSKNSSSKSRITILKSTNQTRTKIQQNKTSQNIDRQIRQTIQTRKLIYLILNLIKFVEKFNNSRLIFQLLLKCQQLSFKMKQQIEICQTRHYKSTQKQFFLITKNQIIKTIDFISNFKQIIKCNFLDSNQQEVKYFNELQEIMRKNQVFILQQILSSQILTFIEKVICESSNKINFNSNLVCQDRLRGSMRNKEENVSRTSQLKKKQSLPQKIDLTTQNTQISYEKAKFCFYLSGKLKYGTFEKFLQRKISLNSQKLNILGDQYFQLFESKAVPIKSLIEEIFLRIQKFIKGKTFQKLHE